MSSSSSRVGGRSSSSSANNAHDEARAAAAANGLVERLVRTVARAFYVDGVIVVLDILIQEKYLREEEFAPRLKLPDKDVKKVLAQLESEMLIRFEDMVMDDGRTAKCYYIDYQLFVNVVRYRIHLMEKVIEASERNETNEVYFECPTCANKYTSLDAQRYLSADFKFICPNCCPDPVLSRATSQEYFRLIEIDNRAKVTDVQLLERKFVDQLNESEHHDGIFDLLHELKDRPLIRNLPSDNRSRGIVASRIVDDQVREDVDFKLNSKVANKVIKKHVGVVQPTMGHNGRAFTVNIETESSSSAAAAAAAMQQSLKRPREAGLPEFLKDSRVKTAEDMLRESFALPGDDDGADAGDGAGGGGAGNGNGTGGDGGGATKGDDADDDDIAWED